MSQPALLTIIHHVAACRGCPFNTRSIRQARIHAEAENHTLSVSKHYLLEPRP